MDEWLLLASSGWAPESLTLSPPLWVVAVAWSNIMGHVCGWDRIYSFSFLVFRLLTTHSRWSRWRQADLMPCLRLKTFNNVGIPVLMYPCPTLNLGWGACWSSLPQGSPSLWLVTIWPCVVLTNPSSNECLLILLPLSPLGRQPFASARVD